MTFSILAMDPDTGAIGGAAATGSLCVGGWVLRGRYGAGLSASQGAAPSTFWGEDVLGHMQSGANAAEAVRHVTSADPGRAHRQLAAMDMSGTGAAFDGDKNTPEIASLIFKNGVAAGNMLTNAAVIDAMSQDFQHNADAFGLRLLDALSTADSTGGDSRGLLSAALLVLQPDQAPLTLRIDYHPEDPIGALRALYEKATAGDYAAWARQVPNLEDRNRAPKEPE